MRSSAALLSRFARVSDRVVVAVLSDSLPDSSSGSGAGVSVWVGRATTVSRRARLVWAFCCAWSSERISACSRSGSIPAIRLLRLVDWDLVALDSAVVPV
jgi:hypothetical protein